MSKSAGHIKTDEPQQLTEKSEAEICTQLAMQIQVCHFLRGGLRRLAVLRWGGRDARPTSSGQAQASWVRKLAISRHIATDIPVP